MERAIIVMQVGPREVPYIVEAPEELPNGYLRGRYWAIHRDGSLSSRGYGLFPPRRRSLGGFVRLVDPFEAHEGIR